MGSLEIIIPLDMIILNCSVHHRNQEAAVWYKTVLSLKPCFSSYDMRFWSHHFFSVLGAVFVCICAGESS